ncbi:MAG: DUF6584 family protein, partial [Beijerinckiaceae bacterium]
MQKINADELIYANQIWKAKQLLQGRLSSSDFDAKLLRQYGELLLLMNDKMEAGRYLYFSGFREEKYEDAIRIFVSKYNKKSPNKILFAMPRMVRRNPQLMPILCSEYFM